MLVLGVKQPLGLKPVFELLVGASQGAISRQLHVLSNQLVVAPGFKQAEFGTYYDLLPGFRLESKSIILAFKHGATDLGPIVLEGEIPMP